MNYCIAIVFLYYMLFCQPSAEGGVPSAVNVAADARANAGDLKTAAENAAEEERAAAEKLAVAADISQASALVQQEIAAEAAAAAELARAEVKLCEAHAHADELERKVRAAEEKEKISAEALAVALEAQCKAQEDAEKYRRAAERAEEAAAQLENNLKRTPAVNVVELLENRDENNIDELMKKIDAAAEQADEQGEMISAARDNAGAGWDRAADAQDKVDWAANQADIALESKELATEEKNEAIELLADAKLSIEDAKLALNDARNDVEGAKAGVFDARSVLAAHETYLAQLNKAETLLPAVQVFSTASNYYSWKDNRGGKGYQFVMPYTFFYQSGGIEASFRTAYIISSHTVPAAAKSSGRVTAWSDSDLTVAYTNSNKDYPVRYSLAINIPTGKETLHGNQAIMSEDLVEYSTFGAGWNYTPGVSVSHKTSKKDTWTLGMTYSFPGKYTLNGDLPDSQLQPGNEWTKTLQWRHNGSTWSMLGEFIHTSYAATQQGGVDYVKEGNQLDTRLTYIRELPRNASLALYYWDSHQQHDRPLAGQPGGSGMRGHYAGAMWSKKVQDKRTFRFNFDFMKKSGESYDVLTDSMFVGGKKFTGGIGYDMDLAAQQKLSFDIQKQFMKNDSNAGNVKYHGYNVMIRYLYIY